MADSAAAQSLHTPQPDAGKIPDVLYQDACPTRNLLELIADKWALLVLFALRDGPARNGALLRRLDGVSQKMLTQTLRNLERNGLVRRIDFKEVPPRVEYHATLLGESLGCKVAGLAEWVTQNIGQVQSARQAFDSQEGGAQNPATPN